MKNIFLILITILLVAMYSCEDKIDYEKEKAAIIKAIEVQNDAMYKDDYEVWANANVQDETYVEFFANDEEYFHHIGWNQVEEFWKPYYSDTITENPKFVSEKMNYRVKVYNNAAWVTCINKIKNTKTNKYINVESFETRVLEKVDGQWKTASTTSVSTSWYKKIAGAWKLVELYGVDNGSQYSNTIVGTDSKQIKIWTTKYFSWLGKNTLNKWTDDEYGGGTYTLKGNNYEEHIEYHSGSSFEGTTVKMHLEIKEDTLIQTYPVDSEGKIDKKNYNVEKYVRLD